MSGPASGLADTGLEVLDLRSVPEFAKRHLRARDAAIQVEGMQRLAHAFVNRPDTILQELVNTAVELCDAESAGISIQTKDENDAILYHWVATAGRYARFLNAMLPPFPSACGICIERGQPQLFRVAQPFFELLGVEADIVTDGLLIPWQVEETHGTIWVVAHGRQEAFDTDDCRILQALANFAALGVRQQRQQKILMEQASAAAAAAMANDLAHKINNPLQSLTNIVYLAAEGQSDHDARTLAREMSGELDRLSALVKKLLELPGDTIPRQP
jgi:signal transduction histidine kinase